MCTKKITEFYVNYIWGEIAIISWGNPENPPILLLHGYMDTAATFTYLVEKLPDKYYYVGIDMPGHGRSDPVPQGLLITKTYVVEVMRAVVEHMKWKKFTFMSHSMSCIMGLLYNTFYPDSIEKIIFLDPKPTWAWYYLIDHHPPLWYKLRYGSYYENYQKLNFGKSKAQAYESWIKSVARNRQLTYEQTEVVLSRSFIKTGKDTYETSWEQRAKYLAQIGISSDILDTIMTKLPPTLIINASIYNEFVKVPGARTYTEKLMKNCEETSPYFYVITVEGGHDFHITNPDLIIDHIENFLTSQKKYIKKSKL